MTTKVSINVLKTSLLTYLFKVMVEVVLKINVAYWFTTTYICIMSPKPSETPAPDMVYVIYLRDVNIGMGYYDTTANQWYDRTTEQPIPPPDEWYPLKKKQP